MTDRDIFKLHSRWGLDLPSSAAPTHDGDTIGASMLRALRKEQCESNPDDSSLRGILRPLQEIEARKQQPSNQKDGLKLPMVVIVDAIDDALGADLAITKAARRGSSTIAHLSERGLDSIGLPPWIKFVVSFRRDMCQIAGPIQRLAQNMKLIHLDPDPSREVWVRQAQEDIGLFVEAFIERQRMKSPLGCHVGLGKWDPSLAARATTKLHMERGEKTRQWEYEANVGVWVAFDEFSTIDLNYCQDAGLDDCVITQGKHTFLVKLSQSTMMDTKQKTSHCVRCVQVNPANATEAISKEKRPEKAKKAPEKSLVRARCNNVGHFARNFPIVVKEAQGLQRTVQEERAILDKFALNAQGNYLYARTVLEDIRSGAMKWKTVLDLPSGLDHLYHRFFRTHFGGHISADLAENEEEMDTVPTFRTVRPVLEVLLAASKRGVTEQDISHSVVAGGACDPAAVNYCLRDIHWALDVDNSGSIPRYSLRHESIRAWLRDDKNALALGVREERGHAYLAASLLQKCWPQQMALSRWLQCDEESSSTSSSRRGPWYERANWEPNQEEEEIFQLSKHLARSNLSDEEARINLLRTVGKKNLDSAFRGRATAVHSAASAGATEAVRFLLAAGANPDMSLRGRRPIHLAASKGFSQTVELLISAGADVTASTSSGRTPLINATGRGSVSTVKCILKAIDEIENNSDFLLDLSEPDCVDASQSDTGRTALSLACEEGFDSIIALLLGAGASPCVADRWGHTPVYYAARYGRVGGDTIKSLVSMYPEAEQTLRWGNCGHNRSPLHEAVWHGHVNAVKVLLECGADPNLVEFDGGSALHEAAYCGSCGHERDKARKKHRREPQTAETKGSTGFLSLAEEVSDEVSNRLEILQLLLKTRRCTVDMVESHGCTPLWYAVCQGWTSAVETLINAGASTNPFEYDSQYQPPSSPFLIVVG